MVQVHCMLAADNADLDPALVACFGKKRQYFSAYRIFRVACFARGVCVYLSLVNCIYVAEKDALFTRLCMSWSEMIHSYVRF